MPIPNSRLGGGARAWPGAAVRRPSPYALPVSAPVVGLLPSVVAVRPHRGPGVGYMLPPTSSRPPSAPRGFVRPANSLAVPHVPPRLRLTPSPAFAAVDTRRLPAPPARVFPPRPAPRITYTIRHVVPPAVGVDPGMASAPRLGAAAAGIGAAAQAAASARPVLTQRALEVASAAGVVTSQHEIAARKKMFELSRLVSVIPLSAIAFACKCEVEVLIGMDTARLATHLLTRGKPAMWVPGTVRDLHNYWVRYMAWLERHDIEHDGQTFNAIELGEFLTEVDTKARAKAEANKARAAVADSKAAERAALAGSAPPPKKRWHDGSHAAGAAASKLKMMRRHFGVNLPVDEAVSERAPGSRPRMPTPALTIGIVFRLYKFVVDVAAEKSSGVVQPFGRVAHAAVAAAVLFASFSCNRCEQANSCSFDGEADGFLHGVLLLDKNPNPMKRQPRPFWMRIAGPDGGTEWFEFLKSVLVGVESGCFVFRDFAGSVDGDPSSATEFINSPLVGPRLVKAIACVIARVCGISLADAMRWAKHSARHFLMECSGARGLHALRAFEIGRWSGSTAQDPDLTPSQREQRRHRLAAGVMPEGYAPLSKVARVCEILGDEMEALDHLWASAAQHRQGVLSIAVFGGFEALGAWAADPNRV